MAKKLFSKITIYPVVYQRDTSLEFILDTNGNKIIEKDYPVVLSRDNYSILTFIENYSDTRNIAKRVQISGNNFVQEGNTYTFNVKTSNFTDGTKLLINLVTNLPPDQYTITPENRLITIINNSASFTLTIDQDFNYADSDEIVVALTNEENTKTYTQYIITTSNPVPNMNLFGPSVIQYPTEFLVYNIETQNIKDGTELSIEILGNGSSYVSVLNDTIVVNENQARLYLSATDSNLNQSIIQYEINFKISIKSSPQIYFEFDDIVIEIPDDVVSSSTDFDPTLLNYSLNRNVGTGGYLPVVEIKESTIPDVPIESSNVTITNTQNKRFVLGNSYFVVNPNLGYVYYNNSDRYTSDDTNRFFQLPLIEIDIDQIQTNDFTNGYTSAFTKNIAIHRHYYTFLNTNSPLVSELYDTQNNYVETQSLIPLNEEYSYPIFINDQVYPKTKSTSSIKDIGGIYINDEGKLTYGNIQQLAHLFTNNPQYDLTVNKYISDLFVSLNVNTTDQLPSLINWINLSSYFDLIASVNTSLTLEKNNSDILKFLLLEKSNITFKINNIYNDIYSYFKSYCELSGKLHLLPTNIDEKINYFNTSVSDWIDNSVADDTFIEDIDEYIRILQEDDADTASSNRIEITTGTDSNFTDNSRYTMPFYPENYIEMLKSKNDFTKLKVSNRCLLTLDSNGSIGVIFHTDANHIDLYNLYGSFFSTIPFDLELTLFKIYASLFTYYFDEDLQYNFWIDENGLVANIPNRDFVDFEIVDQVKGYPQEHSPGLIYIFALHKSGKVYARELTTGVEGRFLKLGFLSCSLSRADSLVPEQLNLTVGQKLKLKYRNGMQLPQDELNSLSSYEIRYINNNNELLLFNDTKYNPLNPKRSYRLNTGEINDVLVDEVGNEYVINAVYEPYFVTTEDSTFSGGVVNPFSDSEFVIRVPGLINIKKIDPYIDGQLNPEFLTLKPFENFENTVYYFNYADTGLSGSYAKQNYRGSLIDELNCKYIWYQNASFNNLCDLSEIAFNTTLTNEDEWPSSGLNSKFVGIPRKNGILLEIQNILKPLQNKKVISFINNNTKDAQYNECGFMACIIQTDEQPVKLISSSDKEYYSYSYELYYTPNLVNCSIKRPFTVNSTEPFSKDYTLKEQLTIGLVNSVNGYYFDTINLKLKNANPINKFIHVPVFVTNTNNEVIFSHWDRVENDGFDYEIYSKFCVKYDNDVQIFKPIKHASIGANAVCLLNIENECLIITNHHNDQLITTNITQGTAPALITNCLQLPCSNTYVLKNSEMIKPFFEPNGTYTSWLYNRGSLLELASTEDVNYLLSSNTTHVIPNDYAHLNLNAEKYQTSVLGLGNPPDPFNNGLSAGLSSSDPNHIVKTDKYKTKVLHYKKHGKYNSNDMILFEYTNGLKIDYASLHGEFLLIQDQNGNIDFIDKIYTRYIGDNAVIYVGNTNKFNDPEHISNNSVFVGLISNSPIIFDKNLQILYNANFIKTYTQRLLIPPQLKVNYNDELED